MRLKPTEDVVWADSDEEVRLYDSATGDFQTLNASAARIWRLVVAGTPVMGIVAELVAAFGADDAHEAVTIESDIKEFIETLRIARLITPIDTDDEVRTDAP